MTHNSTGTSLPLDSFIHGDCIEEMNRLPAESIDVVFADPPYNLQLNKGQESQTLTRPDGSAVNGVDAEWDHFQSLKKYDTFSETWLSAARRLLKPSGTLWLMGSYHNIFRLGYTVQNLDFWILNDIIWIKSNPMPNFRGRRFTNAHETLIWCAKDQSSRYHFEYQAMKAMNGDLQMRSDWYLPICSGKERLSDTNGNKIHPTQKPEALLYRILLASSKPGDLILDPFSGTGTTACVAKQLCRHYIGIERECDYLEHAKTRLENTKPLAEDTLCISRSAAAQPRIPFGRLIENGLLRPGDRLESPCRKWQARVRADGSIQSGKLQGSIHQVGAGVQGTQSCNGWTFWQLRQKKSLDAVSLDKLRQNLQGNFPQSPKP